MKKLFIVLVLMGACAKAKPAPIKESPDDEVRITYDETAERLVSKFLDRGLVISLSPPSSQGDSLIWTGVALGNIPCARQEIGLGFAAFLDALGGGLARHWDLPNDISLDGAIGFYYGVAKRVSRCPAEKEGWKRIIATHKAYVDEHFGRINAEANFKMPPEYDAVQTALFASFDLGPQPEASQVKALAFEVTAAALGVKLGHHACYRSHVDWLALETLQTLGYGVPRSGFCDATSGLDLAVVDQWCGRDGLKDFLDQFQYDTWEYKHQRCPGWESPDGNGRETPAVDRLVGLTMFYQL